MNPMALVKSILSAAPISAGLVSAALILAGLTLAPLAANAQMPPPAPPYPAPYAAPPISPAQALPPAWSYDPYTSGRTACPQKRPGDLQPCSQIMPPTYGQPSYWPNAR